MVPEGWKDASLGDFVRLQRGHDLPATERMDGNVKVIGGGGPNGLHNIARAPAPGIVIGRSGSGIGNAWWSDEPFWPLNTGLYVTDFLGNDPRFCFLWLDRIDFSSHNTGGAQPSLNRNFIYPIPIPLPPLPEQKKIADILSTWDTALETTEKLLANAEAQKRALMQQLLTGKRRLPGFDGREWRTIKLGDAIEINYGKSPNGIATDNGQYPIVGTGGITGWTDQWLTIGPAIVIGRKGTIDKPTLLDGRFWPIDTTFFCIPNRGYRISWVFRALLSVNLRQYNEASGVPSLSRETIKTIPLRAPDDDEQQAIAEIFDIADEEVGACRTMLQHLRTEKSALMQQLLTGKRRVKP